MDGDIKPLNLNLLLLADSAECTCHGYLGTWNILNGEIIGFDLGEASLRYFRCMSSWWLVVTFTYEFFYNIGSDETLYNQKTTAGILYSIFALLVSAGVRLFGANANGLPLPLESL